MTISVGQTFLATAIVRTDAEPGNDREAQSGGAFADLLSVKAKPAGDAKKAGPAKHDAAQNLPDAEPADDPELAPETHPDRQKSVLTGIATGHNSKNPDVEDQPQQVREKLPDLISLQQFVGSPTQPNQPPPVKQGKAVSVDTATGLANSAFAPKAPQEKRHVLTDPGGIAAAHAVQPQALSNIVLAPDETVAAEVSDKPMPKDSKQSLRGLLDDGKGAGKAAPESRNAAEKHGTSGDFTVKGQQSFPAPAPQPISSTAVALVTALDSGLRQASAPHQALLQSAQTVAVPAHILKIELHPAELGAVVASLRLTGQQLSVEIKPETHEAYRRLSADTEALTKSLRSLGFDIDSVTVLQPSVAPAAATRAEGLASMNQAGRDQPSFQPGGSDGRGDGSAGQQSGRNRNHDAQETARNAPAVHERSDGDLFI